MADIALQSEKKFKEISKMSPNSGNFTLALAIDPRSIGAQIAYNQHVFSKNNVDILAFAQGGAFFSSTKQWQPDIQAQAGIKLIW